MSGSESDVDMGSSPFGEASKRWWGVGCGGCEAGVGKPVVFFPAVPVLPVVGGHPHREGTVLDSVDGGDSELDDGLGAGNSLLVNACGRGSRAGGFVCSCEAELGYLSRKLRRLEDMVRLLVASAGLAE